MDGGNSGIRFGGDFVIGFPFHWGKKRAATQVVENSASLALSDVESLSDIFGLSASASGYTVTDKTAMKVAIVYACTRLIAGAIAQMPIKIYRNDGDGRTSVESPLKSLLNLQPTASFSAALYWEQQVTKVLLAGDAFSILLRDRNGKVLEVLPVDTGEVYVAKNSGRLNYHIRFDDQIRVFDQDDILHFSNFGFDGKRAPSVIRTGAINAIGVEMAMEDYSGDFFKNGSHQSIIIRKDGNWTEEQKQAIRDSWLDKYGGGIKNKKFPLVFDKSVGVDQLSVNARDSQLLESREFQITDVARAFGLPSFMVNQEQKSTSWGTGVSEIGQVFLRYTMMPHVTRMEQELNRKLFFRSAEYVKFSTAGLVKATIKDRYESYGKALGGSNVPGFMSINEVRRLEDLAPIADEDYNRPYLPPAGNLANNEPIETET